MTRHPIGGEGGWSLPFVSILILSLGVLTYFFGWMVPAIVVVTLGVAKLVEVIHYRVTHRGRSTDVVASHREGVPSELRCSKCGGRDLEGFVQYGSYILKCLGCRRDEVATSFMAVADVGAGQLHRYQAVVVDEALRQRMVLAEGTIHEIAECVQDAAGRGSLVRLKPIGARDAKA